MSENEVTTRETNDVEQSSTAARDRRIAELEAEIDELEREVAINPDNHNLADGQTPEVRDRRDLEAWSRKREVLDQKRQELAELLNRKK